MYEEMQLYLIIPKIFESILYFIIFLKILKKLKKLRDQDGRIPHLTLLFLIGIGGWLLYITLDCIIYLIAPFSLSSDMANKIYKGYPLTIPSLYIANILRDIAMTGAILMAWVYLILSFYLKYGEHRTNRMFFQNRLMNFTILFITVLAVIGDRIQIRKIDNKVLVNAEWTGLASLGLYLIIFLFTLATVVLGAVLISIIRDIERKSLRRKIWYIFLGVALFTFGDYYWFFTGILSEIFHPYLTETSIRMILYTIGHLIWMLSPIFIYLSLRNTSEPKILSLNQSSEYQQITKQN
ncbi:MAG: hypothetical protein K9W44_16070 [Candidatus Lokiarchaeota archaeon]|nr:hypothetical protein [Candidatus Harpocratesius repetitus]